MDILIGIILIVAAVFLIVAVLVQGGKDKGLSGAISGSSSDTYYGKNKGSSKLAKLTSVMLTSIISFFLIIIIYQYFFL